MEGKLRILAVTNDYPTSDMPGSGPCIKDQIIALRAQGVDLDLLHIDYGKRGLNYAKAAWRLLVAGFQRRSYDLIHAYYGHCGLLARLQLKYPVVVTFRGSDLLDRRDGAIGRIVARLVEGVIVMSEEMKRISKRPDAYIIPFGVDTDLFVPHPMELARRELGFSLSDKLVLFPWNPDRPEKRFDIVGEAIQILQKEQESVCLVVVYGKPHEVIVTYMNACDAMVLASDHEGAPMAVREALACNLPIVSVDVGDVCQIIENLQGCYVCEQEASALAESLHQTLNRRDRTNGRQRVVRMNAAWAAEQVISVYNLVLSKSRMRTRRAGT